MEITRQVSHRYLSPLSLVNMLLCEEITRQVSHIYLSPLSLVNMLLCEEISRHKLISRSVSAFTYLLPMSLVNMLVCGFLYALDNLSLIYLPLHH
jgi:hypothetical protein